MKRTPEEVHAPAKTGNAEEAHFLAAYGSLLQGRAASAYVAPEVDGEVMMTQAQAKARAEMIYNRERQREGNLVSVRTAGRLGGGGDLPGKARKRLPATTAKAGDFCRTETAEELELMEQPVGSPNRSLGMGRLVTLGAADGQRQKGLSSSTGSRSMPGILNLNKSRHG